MAELAAMQDIERLVAAITGSKAHPVLPSRRAKHAEQSSSGAASKNGKRNPAENLGIGKNAAVAGSFGLAAALLGVGATFLVRSPEPVQRPADAAQGQEVSQVLPPLSSAPLPATKKPSVASSIVIAKPRPLPKVAVAKRLALRTEAPARVRKPMLSEDVASGDDVEAPSTPPRLTGAALERALAEDRVITRRFNLEQLSKLPPSHAAKE